MELRPYEQSDWAVNVASSNVAARALYERLGFITEREYLGNFQGQPCPVCKLRYGTVSVKLDVFGKRFVVERVGDHWRTYEIGSDGKRSLVHVRRYAATAECCGLP